VELARRQLDNKPSALQVLFGLLLSAVHICSCNTCTGGSHVIYALNSVCGSRIFWKTNSVPKHFADENMLSILFAGARFFGKLIFFM
jgi:hypothetical protein